MDRIDPTLTNVTLNGNERECRFVGTKFGAFTCSIFVPAWTHQVDVTSSVGGIAVCKPWQV